MLVDNVTHEMAQGAVTAKEQAGAADILTPVEMV